LVVQIRQLVERAYAQIAAQSEADMTELAAVEANATAAIAKRAEDVILRAPRLAVTPMFGGIPLGDWWQAQATDTLSRVMSYLRAAVSPEADVEIIAHNLSSTAGPMPKAERNAESLIHSTVQRISTDARITTLKANPGVITGYEVAETLDSRVCAQCLAYNGSTYDLEGAPTGNTVLPLNGGPPFHINCRGQLIPMMAASKPSGGITAEDWLDTRTEDEQDDILGKGRAALYRKGSLTLRDLVSNTGTQLSLAQLNEKYNSRA
jgi:SPP1 gp7 family putative phage head morphogenesis protein